MKKRAFWLGLLLLSSQLATGCCGYYRNCCHRPFLFPRPWMAGYAPGGDCCGGASMSAPIDYGMPPIAPTGPGMPKSTPLTLR